VHGHPHARRSTSQKTGAIAAHVQQVLGLGSYATAWTWLHKLRRAMVRPDRDVLCGRVEFDETFISGEEPAGKGRKRGTKALVIIAAEENGKGTGRSRMARIPDRSQRSLHESICSNVQPASTIHTDGCAACGGFQKLGYRHAASVLTWRASSPAASCSPGPRASSGCSRCLRAGSARGERAVDGRVGASRPQRSNLTYNRASPPLSRWIRTAFPYVVTKTQHCVRRVTSPLGHWYISVDGVSDCPVAATVKPPAYGCFQSI